MPKARAVMLFLTLLPSISATAPHELPIDYRCDKLTLRRLKDGGHELRCVGAAIFRRDDALLCCDEASGRADAHWRWQLGSCRGDVRLVRGDDEIWADAADFDIAKGELVLRGRPLLRRGGSQMSGEKMLVSPKSEEAQIVGPKGMIWLPSITAAAPPRSDAPWLVGPLPARCPLPIRRDAP